jgi:hypothetical protein
MKNWRSIRTVVFGVTAEVLSGKMQKNGLPFACASIAIAMPVD